jgi:hypothetical protein
MNGLSNSVRIEAKRRTQVASLSMAHETIGGQPDELHAREWCKCAPLPCPSPRWRRERESSERLEHCGAEAAASGAFLDRDDHARSGELRDEFRSEREHARIDHAPRLALRGFE